MGNINLGVLKEKTAKDSIRKEQEIMQIESGSFENEALQKKYYIWSQICGVQKTQKYGNSDPPKSGKLRPRKLRLPKKI